MPAHKLLPFVKHASPSATFFFELISTRLRHRDTKFRKRESLSSRMDPVLERRAWRRETKEGTIWKSRQASNFRFGLICWKIRKHQDPREDELSWGGKWFRRFGEWYHCSFIILTRTDASDIDLHRKLDCQRHKFYLKTACPAFNVSIAI